MSADPLYEHLVRASGSPGPCSIIRNRIVDDPQSHIDALVEAGVLRVVEKNLGWVEGVSPHGGRLTVRYEVVQPEPPLSLMECEESEYILLPNGHVCPWFFGCPIGSQKLYRRKART